MTEAVTFSIRVPRTTYDVLKMTARRQGRTRNGLIRYLLEQALQEQAPVPAPSPVATESPLRPPGDSPSPVVVVPLAFPVTCEH